MYKKSLIYLLLFLLMGCSFFNNEDISDEIETHNNEEISNDDEALIDEEKNDYVSVVEVEEWLNELEKKREKIKIFNDFQISDLLKLNWSILKNKYEQSYEKPINDDKTYNKRGIQWDFTYDWITDEKKNSWEKSYKIAFEEQNKKDIKSNYHSVLLYKDLSPFNWKLILEGMVWMDYNSSDLWDNFISLLSFSSYENRSNIWSISLNIDWSDKLSLYNKAINKKDINDWLSIITNNNIIPPKKEWFKVSLVIDFTQENKYSHSNVIVWINDEIALIWLFSGQLDSKRITLQDNFEICNVSEKEAILMNIDDLEEKCGYSFSAWLSMFNFWFYGWKWLDKATLYNDDISVWVFEFKKQ